MLAGKKTEALEKKNMSPLDNTEKNNDTDGKEISPNTNSTSFSQEKEHALYAVTSNEHAPEIDDPLTFIVSATQFNELPAAVNHQAVNGSSFSTYSFIDGLPIEEQPTWIIPAVSTPQKTANLEGRDQGAQDYRSLVLKLVKSSGLYALSSLTSPLVSLALAPFLTHHFSRTEYGALAILNTFVVLVAGVTQLGLGSAFFRAYEYDYESESDRRHVISTLFLLLLLISLPTAILAAVAAPSLATLLLNTPSLSSAIRVSALVILIQNLTVPGLCWLRAETRAAFYSTVSIINLLVNAGATILFVGIGHMGIEGALLATGAGYAVIVFSTIPMILLRAGVHLRFDIAKGMLVFGFPHSLNLVSGWVLQLLDRYLLGLLGSLSQTAGYAVAYSLGGALSSVIIAPFSLAWWVIMYSIAKRDDAQRVFQLIFRWYTIILLFVAFGISIAGAIVLDLFFPPSYHSAAPVIPVIALSMVFNGANGVLTVGVSLMRKTWLSTVFLTASALINTALNLVLIPHYGAMGAAVSTLIAYIALPVIGYIINQRIYPVPFELDRFLVAVLIGIALYVGSTFLAQGHGGYVGWGISICGLCLYGLCLAFIGMFPNRSRKHESDLKGVIL